ncbi:MAG: thioredoxin family protein [Cellulosilyticaceae bacterium]
MTIKVFGACCARCTNLYELVEQVLEEKGIEANLEKVTDIKEQMKYGIMSLPALMVDEKLVSSGRVPRKVEIEKFICK